jgi:hypothetical protein
VLDILFLRAEGFSCSFFAVFGHNNPGSRLDPDPESMNPDPKHWIIGPKRLLEIKKFDRSIEQRIFREKKKRIW